MNKPDPAKSIDTSKMEEKQARSARRNARLTAWKREGTKAKRQTAQKERIAAWEEATGHSYEEVTHGRVDLPGGAARSGR